MRNKKTYRLWTFQSVVVTNRLETEKIIQANWADYLPGGYFTRSYRWMAGQMTARGINCTDYAPIWAWHSCGGYRKAPRLTDARGLLSDIDISNGIRTVEFECPVELALLSSYDVWNEMLYDVFFEGKESKMDKLIIDRLFATDRRKFKKYDSIQAALPCLKLEWVKEIRNLNLRPNDFNYDTDEVV